MEPMTMMALASAAGMGLGAYKNAEARKQERRDALLAAETARWSPWTGMMPQPIQRNNQTGDIMQGGLSGLSMGQNLASAQAYNKWLESSPNAGAGAATNAETPTGFMDMTKPAGYYPQPAPQAMTALPGSGGAALRGPVQPAFIPVDEFGRPLDMSFQGNRSVWPAMGVRANG